jgi:small subunit ribosomal protein S21
VVKLVAKSVEFIVSNDNVNRTLKAVGRYLQKHHILRTTKTKMYYEKPSEKKLRKSKESARRRKKSSYNGSGF